MAGLNKILVVAVIVHVALFGATIFLTNAISDLPYYGGDHGFLPSTGNSNNTYDRFSAWLSGGGRDQEYEEPDAEGGIAILGWIIKGPICSTVAIVKVHAVDDHPEVRHHRPDSQHGLRPVVQDRDSPGGRPDSRRPGLRPGGLRRAGRRVQQHPPDGGAGTDLRVRRRGHPAQRRRCIVLWLINLKPKPANSPGNDRPLGRTRCRDTWSACRPATATSGG